MNVDRSEFEALRAEVAELRERVEKATRAEEILRRDSEPVRPAAPRPRPRHLRPVK